MPAMIKKAIFPLLFCAVLLPLNAQRIINKSLVNKHARFFYIDANLAHEVLLGTTNSNEIRIQATVEGEYQNEIVLDIRESGSEIYIGTTFSPEFRAKNDKLSAHKVVSITMEILVPQGLSTGLKGSFTHLKASGIYKLLQVDLHDGSCQLDQLSGDIRVTSKTGSIVLRSNSGVVDAATEYGQLLSDDLPMGNSAYYLRSTHGNIHIVKKL